MPSVEEVAREILHAWNSAPRGATDPDERPATLAARAVLTLFAKERS